MAAMAMRFGTFGGGAARGGKRQRPADRKRVLQGMGKRARAAGKR